MTITEIVPILLLILVPIAIVSSWVEQFRKYARRGKRRNRRRNQHPRRHPGWVPKGGPDPVDFSISQSQTPSIPTAADRHREQRAAARGDAGEKELFGILRHGLDPEEYEVLSDIMLPDRNDATTQVDFIVVSEYGVFVIEAKNYSGWLFAREKDKFWTQSLKDNVKNTFPNPIRQNWAHICALESATGIPKSVMFPVVAFSDRGEFKTNIPDGVCYFSEVVSAIQSKTEPLVKREQVPEIVDAILAWDKTITPEQRAAHVANLRARHAKRTSQR